MSARSLTAIPLVLILAAAAAAPAAAGYREDVINDLTAVEGKLVALAEAIPADKFSWQPSEDVRTVSQAFMHVAGGNFFFPNLRGMKPPEDVDMANLEKITDKEKVIATLKASFAHAKKAAEGVTDEELTETMNMFGNEVTKSFYLHSMAAHCHEHLGQMIAYARSIGVTPPWSQQQGN